MDETTAETRVAETHFAEVAASPPPPRPGGRDGREALTEAWRFYYDNALETGPDPVDRAIQRWAVRAVPPGVRVLDVGTGRGHLLAALRPEVGLGIDVSKRAIMDARERYGHLRFETIDVTRLGELGPTGGPFDYIVFNQSLGEMADLVEALRSLHPHLGPWTRLVVIERRWSKIPRWAPAPVRAARPDLEVIYRLGGFEPLAHTVTTGRRFRVPGVADLLGFDAWVLRPSPDLFRPTESLTASVILPVIHAREGEELEALVQRFPELGPGSQYLLVTTPDTHADAMRAVGKSDDTKFKIVNSKSENRADAIREGIRAAGGDVLLILHPHPAETPEAIPRFIEALASHRGELILASRQVYPCPRRWPARLARFAARMLARHYSRRLGCRVGDVNRFLKAIRRRDLDRLDAHDRDSREAGRLDDAHLILAAARAHLKILDIPLRPPSRDNDLDIEEAYRRELWTRLRFYLRALIAR